MNDASIGLTREELDREEATSLPARELMLGVSFGVGVFAFGGVGVDLSGLPLPPLPPLP